jgi:hypothetical protein
MNQDFNYFEFIEGLLEFSPRLGLNERRAAEFLISFLNCRGIPCVIQEFEASVPFSKKTVLEADGNKIECLNSSFVGGLIENKHSIVSSLTPSRLFLEYPNINFNPECREISLSNFYFSPAIAVGKTSLPKILNAKKVKGMSVVEPYNYTAWNILVGNIESPESIIFAHYDSIETGACDNASGISVLMNLILKQAAFLKNILFVFSANEELSFDKPTYWGHGFRAFEKSNYRPMANAKKLIAVDCVGNGKNIYSQNERMKYLVFPINKSADWSEKIFILNGDINKENKVYHSRLDNAKQLSEKYLKDAANILAKKLLNN